MTLELVLNLEISYILSNLKISNNLLAMQMASQWVKIF